MYDFEKNTNIIFRIVRVGVIQYRKDVMTWKNVPQPCISTEIVTSSLK